MTNTKSRSYEGQINFIKETLIPAVVTFAIALFLSLTFRNTVVLGESMLPTFNDGDRLIISNLFYAPARGDVVVFKGKSSDGYDNEAIIKRIIALEGDTVKIQGGIIYVKENGCDDFAIVNYAEDMDIPIRDMKEVTVPKGEMFVMGDNVNASKDSRDPAVGTIETKHIMGKVILRFYIVETTYSETTHEYVTKGRIVFHTDFTD